MGEDFRKLFIKNSSVLVDNIVWCYYGKKEKYKVSKQ